MILSVPYATTIELTTHPTFLDLGNLVSGDSSLAHQTAELNQILLMASQWADNYCEFGADSSLTAHTKTENLRMRPDRYGRFKFHPTDLPFIALNSFSYGRTIGSLTVFANPAVFIEDSRSVVVDVQSGTSVWSGTLQFGAPPQGWELYTSWNYVAGAPNTLLTANVSSGVTSIPVADVTGVQPGQTLKIHDPSLDETVTIASTWVPNTGPTTLPLATGLLNTHATTTPVRVSAMPHDILQAVIYYAIAMLIRPDTSAEDPFPDMRAGASTRLADSRRDGSGLIFEAQHILDVYRRVMSM